MGRNATGVMTVYEAIRIEMGYLLSKSYIPKGCIISSQLFWSNQHGKQTAKVDFRSIYLGRGPDTNYIELSYKLTYNGEKHDLHYKIYLHEQPSNLGKGPVEYFICPQSGKKCRILYSAYGS